MQMQSVLLIDARPPAEYAAGHIPGAVNLPQTELSEDREGVTNLLKDETQVRRILSETGIDPAKHIVVYTESDNAPALTEATRIFWILEYFGYPRVSLLNGGYAAWRAGGGGVEKTPTRLPALDPDAIGIKPDPKRIATLEEVQSVIANKDALLADARPKEYYTGHSIKDYVKKRGHIPTAVSTPGPDMFEGEHLSYKTPAQLKDALTQATGKDTGTPVVTYCNSGNMATVGYLGYRLAGFEDVAVFDGSMALCTHDKALPVE